MLLQRRSTKVDLHNRRRSSKLDLYNPRYSRKALERSSPNVCATRLYSNDSSFFEGPTVAVARRLIGASLFRRVSTGAIVGGRIVETEAYLPLVDPASHGYRGPTKRNVSMFGRPGRAYVYFIYGNYYCLNVTTEPVGIGAAVLIRALEPMTGIDAMRRRRPNVPDHKLASGPGNLCRSLDVDRSCDGADLVTDDRIWIEPQTLTHGDTPHIIASSRIGLRNAATWPLRFYDENSPSISGKSRARR